MTLADIADARVASVKACDFDMPLDEPLMFGDYVIASRGYTMVAVRLDDGTVGLAVTMTRNAPLADLVTVLLAPLCVGVEVDVAGLAARFVAANPAVLAAGLGLRAVSVVECAAVDAVLRRDRSNLCLAYNVARRSHPITAVIGFPPTLDGRAIAAQVEALREQGYRRFKLPVASTVELTVDRVRAVRRAMPDAWVGLDLAWSGGTVDAATRLACQLPDLARGWLEDVFVPGRLADLRAVGDLAHVPVAAGDDDGGPYFVQAAIDSRLDAVRIDTTCQGGIFPVIAAARRIVDAGAVPAPHLYHHVHAQVLNVAGSDGPIEVGLAGSGVDPFGDLGGPPTVQEGCTVVVDALGLGRLHDIHFLLGHADLPPALRSFLDNV